MNSCAPVHPLAETDPVAAAVCNVAERSFFAFAEPGDLGVTEPALSAVVHFRGPVAGEMRVTLPVALTLELAQMFSGDPDIEGSRDNLIDMAGEFANMVTGSWLTATDSGSVFNLDAPQVSDAGAEPPAAAPLNLLMQINGQPVALAWRVE